MEPSLAELVAAAVKSVDKFSVWRSAFERATRVAISGGVSVLSLSAGGLPPTTVVWVAPLVTALIALLSSSTASLMGAGYKGHAWGAGLRFATRTAGYMAVSSALFVLVWPAFSFASAGTAVTIGGNAGLIALVSEFGFVALGQGGSVVALEVMLQAAKEAVLASEGADEVDSDESAVSAVSAVDLDAQLAYRYQRARQDAEEEVRRYLPANPRTAKRMVNHVSLAMAIAEQRGLFDGSTITRQHFRKWIGMSEQWPALGAALTAAPERMADLEKADLPALQELVGDLAPGTMCTEDLRLRLKEGVPLGDVLLHLVRFEPI